MEHARPSPVRAFPLAAFVLASLACGGSAFAQQYRNVVNEPFRTVASGPMSAIVVDVPATRATADRGAVYSAVRAARSRRDRSVARYLEVFRRVTGYRGRLHPCVPDIVVERMGGKPILPALAPTRAANQLSFAFLPTGTAGGWTAAWQSDLNTIIGVVYAELVNVYGPPSWSGTVTIINGDSLPAGEIISDPDALSGGIYNVSRGEITIPQNLSVQSAILNLTQMLAVAFHGPALISYDPWERGMARAATLATLRNVKPVLQTKPSAVFGGSLGDFEVYDPMWHALDRYDWLNQPALGNDRFYPVSRQNTQANTAGFPLMLVPRLQMAGSAWLKVLTEAPTFLAAFNSAYYAALSADPGLRNRVPDLVAVARQALASIGVTSIEGLPFDDWFLRQHVLDSSVSPGPKLYAMPSALRPDATDDDFALGVILAYYRTTFDGSGNSDEVDLNAIGYPIYRDFTFDNRLFIGAQYERVDIRDGIGTVAPTFFNTIGGDAALQGRMRITMDFPMGAESVRIEAAPRSMGKVGQPNNLWGVVVGADTGTLRLEADGIATADIPVRQGAFGAAVDPVLLNQPRRATVTFTDPTNNVTQRRLISGVGEQILVLDVAPSIDAREVTLPAGPAMVAFPIRPLQSRAADALVSPTTGLPLFSDASLLMAQWRQSQPGEDKYLRYPSMEPITPGKGYWLSLPAATTVKITGRLASRERDVTVGLLYGWNQIGNPYETAITPNDLQFQYMADNVPVDLSTAVARGWVVSHTIPGVGQSAIWGYSPATGYRPALVLEPWTGYWIRVLVSEGLTLTYRSPAGRAAPTAAAVRSSSAGWSVALTATDVSGRGATAMFGQVAGATRGRDAHLDAAAPPAFATGAPVIGFDHPEWTVQDGLCYSDFRGAGDRSVWRLTVDTPLPNTAYTLRWDGLARVPRATRLCIVDTATGTRRYMHAASSYAFSSGTSRTRVFEIVPEVRGSSALRILNVRSDQSRAGRGRPVSMSFDLSAPASISAHIADGAGRLIRRLSQGRSASAGTTSLLWDTRDDRGISVPAGAYTVVITARTADGDLARAISPLVLTR
ncbi:MAG: hypothetical protein GX446_14695 [Chthonomonadales bacterium]|nr:hypothetical protein [Chthonomonadales bacterium]